MQQVRAESLRVQGLRDGRHRGHLLRVQHMPRRGDRLAFGVGIIVGHAPEHAGILLDRPRLDEGVDGLLGDAEALDHLGAISGLLRSGEIIDDLRLARGFFAEFLQGLGGGRCD